MASARAGSLIVEVLLGGLGDDDALRRVLAAPLLDEGVFKSNAASGAARMSGDAGGGVAAVGPGVAPQAPAPRAGAVPPPPARRVATNGPLALQTRLQTAFAGYEV